MNMFQELNTLNFTALTIRHDVLGFSTETTVYLRRGSPAGRTFLFLAGYLQPASSWSGLIAEVWRKNSHPNDTLIVIARRGEMLKKPLKLTGLLPLSWQQAEVRSAVLHLERDGILKPEAVIVGHSFGALLGRHLIEIFPHLFNHIIQIAPTPDLRWALLLNWSFWKNGGFLALPTAIIGTLLPWYGVRLSKARLREMFAGKRVTKDELATYAAHCVADSAVLFTQLLLTYRGYELIRAWQHGWSGRITYICCPADAVTSVDTISDLAAEHARAGIPTQCITLAYETPHAWFVSEFWAQQNAEFWNLLFE